MPALPAGRFTLRPWAERDASTVQDAATDPYIVATTTVPAGCGPQQAVEFVVRQWTRQHTDSGYSFAVADGDDVAVGQIGLWLHDRDAGRAEVGYWTAPSAAGKGVATAALTALSCWAQQEFLIPRLQLFIEPWNTGSMKVADRVGYVREGLLRSWREIAGTRRDLYVYSKILGADANASR